MGARKYSVIPVTVAILAQGTSWADALAQAFLRRLPKANAIGVCATYTESKETNNNMKDKNLKAKEAEKSRARDSNGGAAEEGGEGKGGGG